MMDWLLRQARLEDDAPLVDIGLKEGKIAALGENLTATATQTWELDGRVVLPGLVDAHTHLDKTYLPTHNASGTLREAIDNYYALRPLQTLAGMRARMERALRAAIANGVTAMRSHIDLNDANDLHTVEMVLDLREAMRDQITLQLVGLGYPSGTATHRAVMQDALKLGLDAIGGAPAITSDPSADIAAAFALAEQHGKPIDLHVDETEDPHTLHLEEIADRTLAHGLQGQVTAGHCCSLAFAEAATAARVMDRVAEAEMHIITLPLCNLVLMGREMQPAPRGTTLVKPLLARGVNVSAASDNVHDPFNPFGSYDLLQIASLNAQVAHMSADAELYASLAMVTEHSARMLGLAGYGLHAGAPADLVVLDTRRVLEAVLSPPPRLATFKRGRLVVRTSIEREWF